MSKKTVTHNGNQKGVNTAQTNNCQKSADPLRGASSYGKKEDSEIGAKVLQVMEVTGANEEVALMTLHDCEYDLAKTIDFILESHDNNKSMEISVVGQVNNKTERAETNSEQQQWSVSTVKRNVKKPFIQSEQISESNDKDFNNQRESRRRNKQPIRTSTRVVASDENGLSTLKDAPMKEESNKWQNRPAWKGGRVYSNKKKSQEEELINNLETVTVSQSEKDSFPKASTDGLSDSDEWGGESLVVTNKTVVPEELSSKTLDEPVTNDNWGGYEEWETEQEVHKPIKKQTEPVPVEKKPINQTPTIFISRDCSQTRPVTCRAPKPANPIYFAPATKCTSDIVSCVERYHFGNSEIIDNILMPNKVEEESEKSVVEVAEPIENEQTLIPTNQSAANLEMDINLTTKEPSMHTKVEINNGEDSLYNDYANKSSNNDNKANQSRTPDKASVAPEHFSNNNEPNSFSHQDLTRTKSLPTTSEILNPSSGSGRSQINSFKHESNTSSSSENQLNSAAAPNLSSHPPYYPPAAQPLINTFQLPNNAAHFSPNNFDMEQVVSHVSQMNHQNFMYGGDMDGQTAHLNHDGTNAASTGRKMEIPTTAAPGLYQHNPLYPAIYNLAVLAATNPQLYNHFLNMNQLMTPVTNNSNQSNAPIVTSVNQPYSNMKPMNNYQGYNQSYNHSQNFDESDLSSKFNQNKPVYGPSKNGNNYNSANDNKSMSQGNPGINSSGHHPAVTAYPPQTHHAPHYPGNIYGNSWAPHAPHTIIPPPPMSSGHPSQAMGMHLVGHPQ